MSSKTNSTVKGAATGATMGAALGPTGMAIGGAAGALYGYLSGGDSDKEKADKAAQEAKIAQDRKNAIALSNYRQNSRDQYHRLANVRIAPYQAYSNRLAAGYGQGMSTAGYSDAENPLSLADTGVGAAEGSNFTGWNEESTGYNRGGAAVGTRVHHTGIQEYLDGTNHPEGYDDTRRDNPSYANRDVDSSGRTWTDSNVGNAESQGRVAASRAAPPPGGPQFIPGGGGAPAPNASPPNGGYNFMPRRA